MGWSRKYGGKGGSGFATNTSRTLYLLIIGVVILNCQAKPAEPSVSGAEAKDFQSPAPVQKNQLDLNKLINGNFSSGKSREKRSDSGPGDKSMSTPTPNSASSSTNKTFKSGKSCAHGGEVTPAADIKQNVDDIYKYGTRDQINELETKLNKIAQDNFGKFCETGKCYFDTKKYGYACSSTSIQPITILIGSLLAISFLRILH